MCGGGRGVQCCFPHPFIVMLTISAPVCLPPAAPPRFTTVLQAWFHLYRILLTADDLAPADVAATAESFMQTAPLGEFDTRLALLDAFCRQLAAMAAGPAAGEGLQQQQRERWRQLSALLYNLVRYYRQFQPAVERQVAAGMAAMEKQLQVRPTPLTVQCSTRALAVYRNHSSQPVAAAFRTLWRWQSGKTGDTMPSGGRGWGAGGGSWLVVWCRCHRE